MNLYENGENQDSTPNIEPYYYQYYHTENRESTHAKQLIPSAQDEEMVERTNREYEALDKGHVNFHEGGIISNEFRVQNIEHHNHAHNPANSSLSSSCKCRSTIVKPFKCGLCWEAYNTICQLHEHFEYVHRKTEMYLFDKITQTAFPRYWSSSVATQTDTEIEQLEGSVVDKIVTTQNDTEIIQLEDSIDTIMTTQTDTEIIQLEGSVIDKTVTKQNDTEIDQCEVGVVDRIKEELVDAELEVKSPHVTFLDSTREFIEQEHSGENGEEPGKSAESKYCRFTADDSEVVSVDEDLLLKTEVMSTEDVSEVLNEDDSEVVNLCEYVLVKTEVLSTENDHRYHHDKYNKLSSKEKKKDEINPALRTERNSDGNVERKVGNIDGNELIITEQKKNEQNPVQETYANNEMNEVVIDDLHGKPTTPLMSDDGSCSFKCLYCTEKFASYNLYIVHVKEEHGKQTFCKICNKQFSRRKGYLRHLKIHKNPESSKCDKCHEMFPTVYHLNRHIKYKHSNDKTVQRCQKCGEGFTTWYLMSHHRRKCLDIQFPCTFENCDKSFRSKTYLKAHMLTHSGERPFVCEFCGKGFTYRTNFRCHLTSHSKEKFTCNVCGKSYSHRKGLRDHERIHSGEVPYVCEICGKTYKHSHRPEGEPKLFSCTFELCDKTYKKKISLTAHLKTHTGELPFKCDVCGDGFTMRDVLKNHKLQKHSNERPFKCDQCQWAFQTKSGLSKHKKIHTVTQDQMLPCEVCGKAFSNRWNLAAHVRQHTGEKPFVCEICKAAFTHNVSLKNHMKVHKGTV